MKNIFILGYTGVGKTTLKNKIADGRNCIEMSDFLSKDFEGNRTEYLTEYSKRLLQENPFIMSNRLRDSLKDEVNIVSGVRNPTDFIRNFNPLSDEVIIVDGGNPSTDFEEKGLEIIYKYLDFLKDVVGISQIVVKN